MTKEVNKHEEFMTSEAYINAESIVALFEDDKVNTKGFEEEYNYALELLEEEKRLYALATASLKTKTGQYPDGYYVETKKGDLVKFPLLPDEEFKKEKESE